MTAGKTHRPFLIGDAAEKKKARSGLDWQKWR